MSTGAHVPRDGASLDLNPFTWLRDNFRLGRGEAQIILTRPAGADSSYPGLICVESGRIAMSYYSDVAYWSEGRFVHSFS